MFSSNKYDLMEVYNTISKYYPIGLPQEHNPAYIAYDGTQAMIRLLEKNIHDEKNFRNGWERIEKEIQEAIQAEIIGTTYGQSPCYSGYVEIKKTSTGDLTRFKDIYFFISLLGPYYTVVGQDRNEIRFSDQVFRNTNFLVVSPEQDFGNFFKQLCEQIEIKFSGYKFIPYFVYSYEIEGLYTSFRRDNKSSVFEAIFNYQIDLTAPTLGSSFYRDEAWIKEDYDPANESHWVIYPPSV